MSDQGSEGLLSPYLRSQRLKAVTPLIRGRVLDFGCGVGQIARYCDPSSYCGVDRNEDALQAARRLHPKHRFLPSLPDGETFDTIIGLAVIEHIKQPEQLLRLLRPLLADAGQVVLTTPHPHYRKLHDFGALIGIFSREASEEHETFFDRRTMRDLCSRAGWELASARRFLFGANQVFILTPQ